MKDSSNRFEVVLKGETVMILRPYWRHACATRGSSVSRTPFLSRDEALNLAAWIVALADPGRSQFDPLLREILA